MRSGKLDRVITIQANTGPSTDEYGTPIEGWVSVETLRAQLIQASTEEFIRGYGETSDTAIIFRTRYLASVTTDHRIEYDGEHLNIREVKEIGRRKGLELRCETVRS